MDSGASGSILGSAPVHGLAHGNYMLKTGLLRAAEVL